MKLTAFKQDEISMIYNDIVLFTKIARFDNFNHAAKQLGTSQTTLSRRVAKLEKTLNVNLVRRNTFMFELTDTGKNLLTEFENQEVEMLNKIAKVFNQQEVIDCNLRISLPNSFTNILITEHIRAFAKKYPHVQLTILYQNKDISMIKENLDLAIVFNMPSAQSQKVRLLCETNLVAYCYPDYVKNYGLPNSLAELSQHNAVGITDICDKTEKKYSATDISSKEQIEFSLPLCQIVTNSMLHAHELAKNGDLITFGSSINLSNKFKTQELVPVLPQYTFGALKNMYALPPPEGFNCVY